MNPEERKKEKQLIYFIIFGVIIFILIAAYFLNLNCKQNSSLNSILISIFESGFLTMIIIILIYRLFIGRISRKYFPITMIYALWAALFIYGLDYTKPKSTEDITLFIPVIYIILGSSAVCYLLYKILTKKD